MEIESKFNAVAYQIPCAKIKGCIPSITRIYIPSINLVINSDGSKCEESLMCFNAPSIQKTHKKITLSVELFNLIVKSQNNEANFNLKFDQHLLIQESIKKEINEVLKKIYD